MTNDPNIPDQAVILAGGLGTRLLPLTKKCPKPMIEIHGRPFLEYLIEMLRDQGLRRIVMLLGYMPDAITGYFGDGSSWGVSIEYNITDVADDTGTRLRLAGDLLDDTFLLLYCDNYWPLRYKALCAAYDKSGVAAQVVAYANRDGYSRDNLIIEDGLVTAYDKSRTRPGLSGVDLGFLLMRKSLLDLLPGGNISLEAELYPRLVAERQLAAFVSDHRYYSVSSHQRLPLTRDFLERRPMILLDRDGVLNKRMPSGTYVRSWQEWEWAEGALEALELLNRAGYRSAVITNQAGIARGEMTLEEVETIHRRMRAEAEAAGGKIHEVYMCPHHWDDDCQCRKPKPGMLFQAQRDFSLDLTRTTFVGDDDRDRQAAENAGCGFIFAGDSSPLLNIVKEML
ncbi:MAG: HAD-IIIA family hydrolase [Alphaproteobacteria bacterium]|nr:HAD-IIIA family hydrolase [Alphaproteobacteria bacterium]